MTHSSPPPGPPALDHLSIPVGDLDRALGFYTGVLGMRLAWREDGMALVKAGATELALQQGSGVIRAGDALHFGFRAHSLDEVERWAQYLQARRVSGIRLESSPGVAQLYFHDPDGYTLEIYFPGSQA